MIQRKSVFRHTNRLIISWHHNDTNQAPIHQETRTFPGADIRNDHDLVMIGQEQLQYPNIATERHTKMEEYITALNLLEPDVTNVVVNTTINDKNFKYYNGQRNRTASDQANEHYRELNKIIRKIMRMLMRTGSIGSAKK